MHRMCKRAIAMEGTVTGEHGVGLKKREFLIEELGDDTINAMRKVCYSHCSWADTHGLTLWKAQTSI